MEHDNLNYHHKVKTLYLFPAKFKQTQIDERPESVYYAIISDHAGYNDHLRFSSPSKLNIV